MLNILTSDKCSSNNKISCLVGTIKLRVFLKLNIWNSGCPYFGHWFIILGITFKMYIPNIGALEYYENNFNIWETLHGEKIRKITKSSKRQLPLEEPVRGTMLFHTSKESMQAIGFLTLPWDNKWTLKVQSATDSPQEYFSSFSNPHPSFFPVERIHASQW